MNRRRMLAGATSAKTRVLIVHNMPLVRFGLARLIEDSTAFALCGRTGDAPVARELFVREQPDLVVLGLTLAGGDGIELLKAFQKLDRRARCLVFSSRTERLSIDRAFRAGAAGYLLASESTAEVLYALHQINAGRLYASRTALCELAKADGQTVAASELQHLSDRELQVLSLIGRGFGPLLLANELHLSVKTIETYQMHLKEKLGLHSAAELSKKASEWMVKSARSSLQSRKTILAGRGQRPRHFLYSC
jgi:DNA-binding NarL/FixJ family response regulator